MIRENKWKIVISFIAILLPVAAGVLLWDKLPAELPVHWNFSGDIDGTASKSFAIFGLAGIMFAAQIAVTFGIAMDHFLYSYRYYVKHR